MEATHFINSPELDGNYKIYSPSNRNSFTAGHCDDIRRKNNGAIDYEYYEKETRTLRADAICELFVLIRSLFVK